MILSWGKCQVTLTPITSSGATETAATFNRIVEGSTSLETTQGDKTEAKIEGGEVEAVRFGRNTYELSFQTRLGSDVVEPPIKGDDGVVAGEWTATLVPEANEAPGFTIARASVNVQVSYNSSDGAIATYTVTSMKPTTGQQITWAKGALKANITAEEYNALSQTDKAKYVSDGSGGYKLKTT